LPRLIQSADEPDDPVGPMENWRVKLTILQEFIGYVIGELNSRGGYVEGMTGEEEQMVIRATLPARDFEAMAKIVEGLRGKNPGKIEREA